MKPVVPLNPEQAGAIAQITSIYGPVQINRGQQGKVMAATETRLFAVHPSGGIDQYKRVDIAKAVA